MPSRAIINSFVDSAPSLTWSEASDGSILFVNRRFAKYSGFSAEEMLANIWHLLVSPKDRDSVAHLRRKSIAMQEAYCVELRLRSAAGIEGWHSAHVAPIRDEAGRLIAWFGTAIDINDRKQADEALRQSEQRFRCLIDAASHDVSSTGM